MAAEGEESWVEEPKMDWAEETFCFSPWNYSTTVLLEEDILRLSAFSSSHSKWNPFFGVWERKMYLFDSSWLSSRELIVKASLG